MNGKTAKLIRSYTGLRKKSGAPIALRDVKARYRMIPRPMRGFMKDAMAAYMLDKGYTISDAAEARIKKSRFDSKEKKGFSGLLAMAARLFGLAGHS